MDHITSEAAPGLASTIWPIETLEMRMLGQKPQERTGWATTLKEEWLPFTVRLVRNEDDLRKAVEIRHLAYARHLPDFAEQLKRPEAADYDEGVVVLLAESKLDGSPLGTMRIQNNRHKPLVLEQSVTLPDWLSSSCIAEATRLGVTQDLAGRLVKTALFKAFFMHCQADAVDYMVIAGRSPIDRQYQRLQFSDVYPELGYVPLQHAGNLPHRIMSFEVETAEERWARARHPLFDFVFRTHHPDIQLKPVRLQAALSDFPGFGAVAMAPVAAMAQ